MMRVSLIYYYYIPLSNFWVKGVFKKSHVGYQGTILFPHFGVGARIWIGNWAHVDAERSFIYFFLFFFPSNLSLYSLIIATKTYQRIF